MPVDCHERLHERLPARPENIPRLRHSVLGFAGSYGASERQRENIGLAVSEAVSNAVVHAYVGRDSPGPVAIDVWVRGRALDVVVCDEGIGMRPRTDSPGLGLGLSLMARVAEQFELESPDASPGVRVHMTFEIG